VKISQHLLIFLLLLLGANFVTAQESISQAKKKAIQQKITKETAKILQVDADRLRLKDRFIRNRKDLIFISFDIQNLLGQPFDYKDTHLYEAAQEKMFKNSVEALLQRKNAHWELVDIAVNANNVVWGGWAKKHNAPAYLFNIICLRQTPEDCQELSQIPATWRGMWLPPFRDKYAMVEPFIMIENQTITWEPCGPDARKVRIFSKFFGHSVQGLLLEIEGEPCSYTDYRDMTKSISYIHLEKGGKKDLYAPLSCPVAVALYDRSDKLGANENWDFNIYTKSTCSVFNNSEKYEIHASIKKTVATQLKMETSQISLSTPHLEGIGDWIFITAGVAIDLPNFPLIGEIPADAISHFISALLRRKGNTWELVEKELDVAAKKELYQEWSRRHHIPQDDSNKRICPQACPSWDVTSPFGMSAVP